LWRRPVVGWIASLVAVWVVAVATFRRHRPAVLDEVRRFNRRVLNPAMLHLAGRRHWYAARLEHVGRRSGLARATPVVARPLRAGFAVPLPYGTDVDWLRNIQASGRATLVVRVALHRRAAVRAADGRDRARARAALPADVARVRDPLLAAARR
jgi:deazaflavin-dependent oxidoreductase (nitroreductase family)